MWKIRSEKRLPCSLSGEHLHERKQGSNTHAWPVQWLKAGHRNQEDSTTAGLLKCWEDLQGSPEPLHLELLNILRFQERFHLGQNMRAGGSWGFQALDPVALSCVWLQASCLLVCSLLVHLQIGWLPASSCGARRALRMLPRELNPDSKAVLIFRLSTSGSLGFCVQSDAGSIDSLPSAEKVSLTLSHSNNDYSKRILS